MNELPFSSSLLIYVETLISKADIGMAPDMPPKPPIPCWALGKAAVPQRQEHSHAPEVLIVPVPETIEPELELELWMAAADAVAEATETVVAAEAATLAVPPAITAAVPVPFCAMAICWKSAWVLLAVGLIEKVIPFPQCPFCLQ